MINKGVNLLAINQIPQFPLFLSSRAVSPLFSFPLRLSSVDLFLAFPSDIPRTTLACVREFIASFVSLYGSVRNDTMVNEDTSICRTESENVNGSLFRGFRIEEDQKMGNGRSNCSWMSTEWTRVYRSWEEKKRKKKSVNRLSVTCNCLLSYSLITIYTKWKKKNETRTALSDSSPPLSHRNSQSSVCSSWRKNRTIDS